MPRIRAIIPRINAPVAAERQRIGGQIMQGAWQAQTNVDIRRCVREIRERKDKETLSPNPQGRKEMSE
jgi:hypothetical protein